MSDSSSSRRLRGKLLAALASGSMATIACGGSVESSGTGGSGAVAGIGGTSSGGTSSGGTSSGGSAGTAGIGGMAGAGGDGPFFSGNYDCNSCAADFYTCWKVGAVPVYPDTGGTPGNCPPATSVDNANVDPCTYGYGVYFQGVPIEQNGTCCYLSGFMCPGGRPFKIDGELRVAAVCRRSDWLTPSAARDTALDAAARRALTIVWLSDAQLEHASVAAFARLTLELMQLGAPAALVAASQSASLDEMRHARTCFGLASRFAGTELGPEGIDLRGALGEASLEQLVRETVEEGCVGETLAALQAAEQRARAADPEIRAALDAIEREESEHAAFAFRVVRWAIARGGDAVRRAAQEAFDAALSDEREMSPVEVPEGVALPTWHHYGRLSAEELRAVRARGIEEVVRPCMATLFPAPEARAIVAA